MKNGNSVTGTAFDVGYESMAGFTDAIKKFTGFAASTTKDSTVVYLDRIMTPLGPMLSLTGYGGGLHRKRMLLALETGTKQATLFE